MAARFDTQLGTTEMTGAPIHALTSLTDAAILTDAALVKVSAGNDHALAGGYAG